MGRSCFCSCSCGESDYEVVQTKMTYDGAFDGLKRPHGQGTCYFEDGESYSGEWVHGVRHGYGKYVFSDGRTLTGYFENDKYVGKETKNGYGSVTLPNDPVKNSCYTGGEMGNSCADHTQKEKKGFLKLFKYKINNVKRHANAGGRQPIRSGPQNEVPRFSAPGTPTANGRHMEDDRVARLTERRLQEEQKRKERENYYREKYNIPRRDVKVT